MKCDKLQRYSVDIDYVPNDDGTYMDADEVNEAIAELKQTIDKLVGVKKSAEQILQNLLDCGLIKEWYFNGKFNVVIKADDPHLQIAELKQKLQNVSELLTETREWLIESHKMHKRCADGAIKKIRHHKYKRCLAMAELCKAKRDEIIARTPTLILSHHTEYLTRWEKRWLELAEKFKEAK